MPRALELALHAPRASLLATDGRVPQHGVKLQLVSVVLPGRLVVVSVHSYHGKRPLRAERCISQHVWRLIDLPFVVGCDFNVAGKVPEHSGWPQAPRACASSFAEQGHANEHRLDGLHPF